MSTGFPHAGALLDRGRRLITERDPAALLAAGYAEQGLFDRQGLGHNVAFVAKPFSAAGLVTTVRNALDA